MTIQRCLRLFILITALLSYGTIWGASSQLPFSIAVYYADNPPVNELKAFDVVVIDPDSGLTPEKYGTGRSSLFSYVSVGEAEPDRSYTKQMNRKWFVGENKDWNSKVVDVSSPAWRKFFLDKVIEPLWKAGYRGFFLDTMDSYQLSADKSRLAAMESGLAETVRAIKTRHPEARLILNRGFEILPRVKDLVFAVAAESLYQNFSPATGKYGEVPPKDREWLTARLNEVKKAGVPAIVIDYVPPGKRDLARRTAEKIKKLGFIPWVTDKDLGSLGVGAVEVMPRRVLGLYDGAEADDVVFTSLHRFGAMPLNYLGYQLDLHDLKKPLPKGIIEGRYAGVVVWPISNSSGEQQGLREWTSRCIAESVPIVFIDRFGVPMEASFLSSLGLELVQSERVLPPVKILYKDSRIGFEQQPLPQATDLLPLKLLAGKSLLKIVSGNGIVSDSAAITPWGGYLLQPFAISTLIEGQVSWVVDPFRFFKDALRLPDMPVPDVTTENGTRLLLTHIDADGFESMAEWPGGRISARELRERILEKYRIPVTVSIITGVTSSKGLYPNSFEKLEEEARTIFKLPWVEAASHSFSHPFFWRKLSKDNSADGYNLKIPGYKFSLKEEVAGSVDEVNRLLPPGKKVKLFLWTGDCTPGADAIEETYRIGVGNLNSGDTLITESKRSITDVSPLGVSKSGWFQIYAPNQNENVYTNNWTGPFYGFQRVIETFRMTDKPRRLKPVNIYYHFYSASKVSSLNALRKVYDWAEGQRLFSVFASEYVDKVLDFNRTVVARDGSGWLIRNNGQLRQMRIPSALGYPDLQNSSNVAGFNDHGDSRYLHLLPGGDARVQLAQSLPGGPYLASAGGFLDSFEQGENGLKLGLHGYTPFAVRIANAGGCRFSKGVNAVASENVNELVAELPEGKHAFAVYCK